MGPPDNLWLIELNYNPHHHFNFLKGVVDYNIELSS